MGLRLSAWLASCCVVVAAFAPRTGAATVEVETGHGPVQGRVTGGIEEFLGVPYAAPPLGELRWRAPQPPEPWSEAYQATGHRGVCPQPASLDSVRVEDEDCLYLNVQRPAGTEAGAELPVLVYIHGGGLRGGAGSIENLNRLVEANGIVGVTMNYRLGTLGFLAHPALSAEADDSGNYGFLDQQAALEWVRDNIAGFGGDPGNVTLAGESAGGASVCVHLAAPSSEGLFHKAIMQSTYCSSRWLSTERAPREQAEHVGVQIARSVGCEGEGETVAACLREVPVAAFLDAPSVSSASTSGTAFLPDIPIEAIKAGRFSQVPVLIGSQLHEGRSFITNWAERSVPSYDREGYEAFVREKYGVDADDVLAAYPWPDDAGRHTGAYLVADLRFAGAGYDLGSCQTNNITDSLAGAVTTYAYEFAHSEGIGWFEVPGFSWGAGHATELPYLIPDRGNFAFNARAFGDAERQLSDEMVAYWGSFIKNGDPNNGSLLSWPRYQGPDGRLLSLRAGGKSTIISSAAYRAAHKCAFWESKG